MYIYDLYLQLDVRRAELAPFDNVSLIEQKGAYAPSQIVLSTRSPGPTLQIEKHGEAMQLHLQLPKSRLDVALHSTGWTTDGETMLRFVQPDFAEMAIFDVLAAVKL